ncbi:MAG: replication protein DnaC [Solirubrobacteraceae bacterium]|nr:replication protein DnaC [Solirubrobacteraceae bacterium]
MSAPCPFNLCDGSGFVVDEAADVAYPCRCRPQRLSRAKARSLSAVIPARYRGVGFDRPPVTEMDRHVVDSARRYVARIHENLDAGEGMWLVGDVGTGKTTLAMLISRSAIEAGRSVAIYSLPRLIALLRHSYDDGSSYTNIELIDRLTSVDLLHLDDLGAERTNDWVLEQIYSIVNARYEAQRSIVVTSNEKDLDKLREQLTERTVSRLREMCQELPMFGADHRPRLRTA